MNELELALQEAYEAGISDGYDYALDEMGNRASGKSALHALGNRVLRNAYNAGASNNIQAKQRALRTASRIDDRLNRHANIVSKLFGSGSDYADHAQHNFESGSSMRKAKLGL